MLEPRLRLGVSQVNLFGLRPTVSSAAASSPPRPKRPLSLGVIFLTLYIDLIGFSIIFPLGPDLIHYYLGQDGNHGILGWLLEQAEALAQLFGGKHDLAVFFGGLISSLFSILQF